MQIFKPFLVVLALLATAATALADATVDQLVKSRFSGAGKIINVFAGKAAKEGLETRTAISGDRKATMTGRDIEVVDLGEEMIWRYSVSRKGKAKKCRTTTFAEFREQMAALGDLPFFGSGNAEQAPGDGAAPLEYEVTLNFTDTDEPESHAGMTGKVYRLEAIAHRPGLPVAEGGGIVETVFVVGPKTESWAQMQAWHERWAESIGDVAELGQNLVSVLARNPALQELMAEMRAKEAELDGTMLRMSMRLSTVPDPRMQQQAQSGDNSGGDAPTSLGGLGAKIGGAFLKKKRDDSADAEPREIYMSDVTVTKISDMPDAILNLPDTCKD